MDNGSTAYNWHAVIYAFSFNFTFSVNGCLVTFRIQKQTRSPKKRDLILAIAILCNFNN